MVTGTPYRRAARYVDPLVSDWVRRTGVVKTHANVVVLEARGRAGGRVLQHTLPGGGVVQSGGEASSVRHSAYRAQSLFIRRWGRDPYTQGYITVWRPGDVTAVGPLHGTDESPLYICGSDEWVCGYVQGAVRAGRAAAILGDASRRGLDRG